MTQEERQQLNDLLEFKKNLESYNTIPLNIDQSFRARFPMSPALTTSSKGTTSSNQSVNEAGSATYSVLKAPDGYIQVVILGTTYYIPIFLS